MAVSVPTERRTPIFPPGTEGGAAQGQQPADPRRWQALWAIVIAACMDILDANIVTLAVPFIQRDLGATYTQIQWVLAAYTLAFAVTLITGGRLGDIYGRRRVFLLGIAGFTLASLLCGLAPSPQLFIALRAVQGALAGVMVPQVLAIIQTSLPATERGAELGAYGAVLGLGNVAGPVVAALVLQANLLGLEWRPIFLINLPFGVLTILVVLAGVPHREAGAAPGVLSAVMQVGSAAGVSAIGLEFFSLLADPGGPAAFMRGGKPSPRPPAPRCGATWRCSS